MVTNTWRWVTSPAGIGRCGSLMASTSRSQYSLMTCDNPHRIGPAINAPRAICDTVVNSNLVVPDAIVPQINAIVGGNHVTGFISAIERANNVRIVSASLGAVLGDADCSAAMVCSSQAVQMYVHAHD